MYDIEGKKIYSMDCLRCLRHVPEILASLDLFLRYVRQRRRANYIVFLLAFKEKLHVITIPAHIKMHLF